MDLHHESSTEGDQQFLPKQYDPTSRIQRTQAPLPPSPALFLGTFGRSYRWVVFCWQTLLAPTQLMTRDEDSYEDGYISGEL